MHVATGGQYRLFYSKYLQPITFTWQLRKQQEPRIQTHLCFWSYSFFLFSFTHEENKDEDVEKRCGEKSERVWVENLPLRCAFVLGKLRRGIRT